MYSVMYNNKINSIHHYFHKNNNKSNNKLINNRKIFNYFFLIIHIIKNKIKKIIYIIKE